ncbi:MAG: DUF1540 domain-containing protein [Christensenellaceae bacterium]|jgi:hypothetical protein|nr:DUF1540 domain-containing protein [Christensenellaceae bacterium]
MNQLKCTTINCQHNLKTHCNAGIIGVSEKCICESRIKRVGGALEQAFAEIEASDEFPASIPNIVQCEASCIYNVDNRCSATSILVSDSFFNPKCRTLIRR